MALECFEITKGNDEQFLEAYGLGAAEISVLDQEHPDNQKYDWGTHGWYDHLCDKPYVGAGAQCRPIGILGDAQVHVV